MKCKTCGHEVYKSKCVMCGRFHPFGYLAGNAETNKKASQHFKQVLLELKNARACNECLEEARKIING
jgi:hypothetical protein